MFSLKNNQSFTKFNTVKQNSLQKFTQLILQQINQEVNNQGCILITKQPHSNNITETIGLFHQEQQQKSSFKVLEQIDFDFKGIESEIYNRNQFKGYLYSLRTNDIEEQFLLVFCQQKLSTTQRAYIQRQNQLLEEYLSLQAKYQQQKEEFGILETLFYQMAHKLRNSIAEISIIHETIYLNSTNSFCISQAKVLKDKILNLNLDIRYFLQSRKSLLQKSALHLLKKQQNERDIKLVFEECLEEHKHLIQQKRVKIQYSQKSIFLKINSFQLKQIFDNLLTNAVYFSPEQETINCSWEIVNTGILITISDRGIGLSPSDQQNMFLPFYSRREHGQGLGLTIVKKLVLDLNGSIWGENLSEKGAKFSIILPK